MKVPIFKAKNIFLEEKANIKAVLFHGDIAWFVDYVMQDFCKHVGLPFEPSVPIISAKDFWKNAQQATFFSVQRAELCGVSGIEQGTAKMVKDLIAEVPDQHPPLVMCAHAYLRPSLAIRRYFEKASDLMIVPAYAPNTQQIGQYIKHFFQERNLNIESSALACLTQNAVHFTDNIKNILTVMALYHQNVPVAEESLQRCLDAVRVKSNVTELVQMFFLQKKAEFLQAMLSVDVTDTAEVLYLLRIFQDAAITILLAQKSLLPPSDARAFKWKAVMPAQKMWPHHNLVCLLGWVARAEVSAKKKEFFRDVVFLFEALKSRSAY